MQELVLQTSSMFLLQTNIMYALLRMLMNQGWRGELPKQADVKASGLTKTVTVCEALPAVQCSQVISALALTAATLCCVGASFDEAAVHVCRHLLQP